VEGSSYAPEAASPSGRGATRSRRVFVPVRIAFVRLRAHRSRNVLAALGIAVGAAMLAMTAVGAVAVQDRAVQRALAGLQPSDRAVQAVWSGVPAQSNLSYPQLDGLARGALEPVLHHPAFGVEVFRQATWGGAFVNLGAVDGLSRWLVLRSGRLPRACTPRDCELVQIGGGRTAAPKLPFLHIVGRASFRSGAPLAAYFAAAGASRPPILLADGVAGLRKTPLPDATDIARTYGWVVPLAPGAVHDWDLAGLGARIDAAQSQLEERSDIFSVSAPLDTIAAVRATSRVAGERLLVLGGDAAVLLLGFAILASTRLRRDFEATRRRLTWFGARRGQMLLVAVTELGAVTLAASLAGWVVGSGAGAVLARHLGAPGWLAVEHALLTWRSLGVAVALAVLTTLVMLAALRLERIAFGGLSITAADVAALGALAAILLALARGKTDTATLASSGGTGVVLLLLPALVLFVLAVVAARLVAPLLRGLERLGRGGPPSLRLALLSLARSPGAVLLSVVFFVLSVGVALFAFSYRATLERGEAEQARYAVPAPFILQENLQKLVTVQQAAPHGGTPVLRDDGYVTANRGIDFTLLALPAAAIPRVDGWRSDFSALSTAAIAKLLTPPVAPHLRGIDLPAHATHVTLPLTIAGDRVGIQLNVLDPRGDFTLLPLGELGGGSHAVTVRLPPEARGGRIVAMRLSFPQTAAFLAGHRESGTTLSVNDTSTGTIRLDPRFAGWLGTNGVRVRGTTLHYVVNRAADSILRPREPLEGAPVPVLVSPALARTALAGGLLPLHVEDETIEGRVVGVAKNFPSVDGNLVVADLPTWLTAANTIEPGTTTASEIWLDARTRPHVPSLAVESQRAMEASLRSDPLARGSLALLLAAAVVGLALAAVGILLGVVGDRRDDSGELFDLSAQGVTPAELRRHLLLRAAIVAAVGIAGGVAAGAIVSALVVAVVAVTAGAGTPVPSLSLQLDWPLVAAALACLALGSAALAAVAVRRPR
jgi:hypothetical protein